MTSKDGADGRSRTGTELPPADFESAASAYSTTSAFIIILTKFLSTDVILSQYN